MQRPWIKDDAEFCYSFVSNIIFKWQQEQLELIYEIKIDPKWSKQSRIEHLGNVELIAIEHGCEYLLADND
ncbi:hypothetical protein, partial [Paenibacillus sp. 7516]|uniref:hypothetical protein n=1 Tax=Paenibacillus sp. 7516 TaxID=2022549 RepID=UPI001483549B